MIVVTCVHCMPLWCTACVLVPCCIYQSLAIKCVEFCADFVIIRLHTLNPLVAEFKAGVPFWGMLGMNGLTIHQTSGLTDYQTNYLSG